MSDFNDIILGQNQGRRGQTTYHYLGLKRKIQIYLF